MCDYMNAEHRAQLAEVEADLQEMVDLWDACMCREKCLTAERDRYKAALEGIIAFAESGIQSETDKLYADYARTALKGER